MINPVWLTTDVAFEIKMLWFLSKNILFHFIYQITITMYVMNAAIGVNFRPSVRAISGFSS